MTNASECMAMSVIMLVNVLQMPVMLVNVDVLQMPVINASECIANASDQC